MPLGLSEKCKVCERKEDLVRDSQQRQLLPVAITSIAVSTTLTLRVDGCGPELQHLAQGCKSEEEKKHDSSICRTKEEATEGGQYVMALATHLFLCNPHSHTHHLKKQL
jgi:hypothetical protein